MLTRDSRIKDMYANPVGHDMIDALILKLGASRKILSNSIFMNMKLRTVKFLEGRDLTDGLLAAVLSLCNSEKDVPADFKGQESHAWWKEAVFYMIRSDCFRDSEGDGNYNLAGVIEKLDYLKNLGINAILLFNFGNENPENLVREVHARGMRLIICLGEKEGTGTGKIMETIAKYSELLVDGYLISVAGCIFSVSTEEEEHVVDSYLDVPGFERFYSGGQLHDSLREIRRSCQNAVLFGDAPGVGLEMTRLLSSDDRRELNLTFSGALLRMSGKSRYSNEQPGLRDLRDLIIYDLSLLSKNCRLPVYFNGPDTPKMVSKFCTDPVRRRALSKLLAALSMTIPGVPFIYQGDEMGLCNREFKSLDDIISPDERSRYDEMLGKVSANEAFRAICAGSRTHAAVKIPWPDREQYMKPDPSVRDFYRQLIALHSRNEALIYGSFKVIDCEGDKFTFMRKGTGVTYYIDCNLSDGPGRAFSREWHLEPVLFSESAIRQNALKLEPYEVMIWRR